MTQMKYKILQYINCNFWIFLVYKLMIFDLYRQKEIKLSAGNIKIRLESESLLQVT